MKVRELARKSSPRIDISHLSSLGIQSYGGDNLYPQTFRDIVEASPNGIACTERLASFIEGNGFATIGAEAVKVNKNGDTIDDILSSVASDVAYYNGFALHVNYNVEGQIVEVQHVPFENVRLCEPDDKGYVAQVALHPDWSGRRSRSGKVLKVNKDNVDYIALFNPIKEVVQAQIAAKNISNYKGQVLWCSLKGRLEYPAGKGDRVVTEMSTDEGLSNIKYRNTRCNFMPAAMLITKRGASSTSTNGYDEFIHNDDMSDTLSLLQGDTNAMKLMEVTIESDDERPELIQLDTKNYDKEFSVTESSVSERIYAAFNQEPWFCIRQGKVGFSGDILKDAFDYYNSIVSKQQRFIEREFRKIFALWHGEDFGDLSIEPLIYKTSEK